MKLILLAVAAFSISLSAFAQDLVFQSHGKTIKTLSLESIAKLAPNSKINVLDPHPEAQITFEAIDMKTLLKSVYGDELNSGEEILFTCRDGYQPSIPLKKFNEHKGYLAYRRADQKDSFSIPHKADGRTIDVSPYYLVWDSTNDNAIIEDGETDWPYQITTIDLIRFTERFPNSSPPKNSSVSAKNGFVNFRKYCMVCHTMNGEGGAKAPDLNYPVNVTEYFKEPLMRKFITNSQSVRFNSAMPSFANKAGADPKFLDDLVAYLKSMSKNKHEPKKK